ncbi:MAG: hypothetical protein C4295_07885 [Candidatus Fervidibacterota bacterium]
MRQERWVALGLAVFLSLLILAWRMAVKLALGRQPAPVQVTPHPKTSEGDRVQMKGGQLVAEIPERAERWVLLFSVSHFDPDTKVATIRNGRCQVTRKDRVVAEFQAPVMTVRFAERTMEMSGGVLVFAPLPHLKVTLPSLRWHWETGRLVGRGKVRVEGERVVAIADGLEGDTTLQQLSLKGRVAVDWFTPTSGQ